MILALAEAKKLNPNITQIDLDGIEEMIRSETNNNFHDLNVRKNISSIRGNGVVIVKADAVGFVSDNTVEINGSLYNDGLYVVKNVSSSGAPGLTLDSTSFIEELLVSESIITKVVYPSDVIRGVHRLITYDAKMGSKLGIKSESVSRVSTTYYDLNASDNQHGYPKALMSFLKPYRRMRW